ncbi:MAG TPA: hypothetical protein VF476_13790 [Chitinophagaceae bacterium]
MTILLLTILIRKFKKWNAERQLKWQQALINNGIGFRTEVLDVKRKTNPLKDHVKYSILIHLRVKGKVVCRRVHTLLKHEGALQPGDKIHIRYNPYHLNYVLLCSDH